MIKQKFEDEKSTRTVSPRSEIIQENVKGYVRAAGWGKFTWETEEHLERVLIQDPPVSKGVPGREISSCGDLLRRLRKHSETSSSTVMEDPLRFHRIGFLQ